MYITPAIGYPVDMHIHANLCLTAGDAQSKISTFNPDSGKRQQNLFITGLFPTIFLDHSPGNCLDLRCFSLVKGTAINQPVNLFYR